MKKVVRPDIVAEEHLQFLSKIKKPTIRDLQMAYPHHTWSECKTILTYYMYKRKGDA